MSRIKFCALVLAVNCEALFAALGAIEISQLNGEGEGLILAVIQLEFPSFLPSAIVVWAVITAIFGVAHRVMTALALSVFIVSLLLYL